MAKNIFRIDEFVDRPWPMNFLMTYNAALAFSGSTILQASQFSVVPDGSSPHNNPPQDIESTILYMLSTSYRTNAMVFILGYYRDGKSSGELAEAHGCTRSNVSGVIRGWFETHLSTGNRKMLTYGVETLVSRNDRESYQRGYTAGYESGYYFGYRACQQEQEEAKNKKDNPNAKCALSTTIEEMNLSIRTYNCLKRAGLDTVGKLTVLTQSDIKKIRNLGRKSFDELIFKLHTLGYDLAEGEKEE